MRPESAGVTPPESQQPLPATRATTHWGAGVPDGEGVDVSVSVEVGVGVAVREAVVVAVGDAEGDAPDDMEADSGVVVGDSEVVEEKEGGALKTTVAIAPWLATLLSDQKKSVKVLEVEV